LEKSMKALRMEEAIEPTSSRISTIFTIK
jgi:hypothetical protein